MARGGLGYEGIKAHQTTFKAGAGIKALVVSDGKDSVVGVPVVISGNDTVDLGTDGDTVFGFIDVYENDSHVSVQDEGYRTDVPIGAIAPTVGKIAAVDGTGKSKDSATTAKLRSPVFTNVDSVAKTATIFLG
ncbi:MAG TPA: hypothetical protein GX707_09880 [Epulopiscium sp.]|nr:hypothetical protein [Candidatus Epulonipiscium sp.]